MESTSTEKKTNTDFSSIGKMAAINTLFEGSGYTNCGNAVEAKGMCAHRVMMEGVDFDLVYTPLKHLGYKAALSALGELYAEFCTPQTLSVIIGVSARFYLEQVRDVWQGIVAAATEHKIKNLGLNLVPSANGLYISMAATSKNEAKNRPEAKTMDLICLSGNVGAAYMGQHVLEREKAAFMGMPDDAKQPDLSKYKYILSQFLSPELPVNTISRFKEFDIVPSAGVFLINGLADGVKRLAAKTGLGAKVYISKVPIASQTFAMAEELNIDAVTAALNGGDDYRLLFTIPISMHDTFHKEIQTYDIIGHLCQSGTGTLLVTPDGAELDLKAQGWE